MGVHLFYQTNFLFYKNMLSIGSVANLDSYIVYIS